MISYSVWTSPRSVELIFQLSAGCALSTPIGSVIPSQRRFVTSAACMAETEPRRAAQMIKVRMVMGLGGGDCWPEFARLAEPVSCIMQCRSGNLKYPDMEKRLDA